MRRTEQFKNFDKKVGDSILTVTMDEDGTIWTQVVGTLDFPLAAHFEDDALCRLDSRKSEAS